MTNNNTQAKEVNLIDYVNVVGSFTVGNGHVVEVSPHQEDKNAKRIWKEFWCQFRDAIPASIVLKKDGSQEWLDIYADFCELNKVEPDWDWLTC